ncbi:electron transport complex, RnfABCDGE type, C subunit [Magnetococcus marinus MC-1]|uniref:Ion-translocating oxidoreductase complex subunit C n=1 Tax=Magnetococcus marinus (strain ATCC BAA-1437 / JCM 17883 / MC-1) TaxID=156889 RepID=A0L5G6_MAGMM|nr:electron transport complex subunit RsxC [Magnetococcus marinus]ABK43209.1 electron transport complex, RnfABCDGE type, C subunit [Magnetococcus marinus MC-1]
MGILQQVLRAFHGGVHPDENKDLTAACRIESMPIPARLYVPLHQHIGRPCDPAVGIGDKVLKGQLIGKPDGFISAPVHAPTSGTIVDFVEHAVGHPSGLPMLCAVLDPDGEDRLIDGIQGCTDPFSLEPAQIRDAVRHAGIVGLGGATFPSHVKLSPPGEKKVELLVLNGVECEPYLTCDARLMEERSGLIVTGVRIMLHALHCKEAVIGIEDNKPGAIAAMKRAVEGEKNISVRVLPVMYPQGSEKQLIEVLTGRQVPSGGLPIDVGVVCHNIATAIAIKEAIVDGMPLLKRVVTVTGRAINRPANVECLLGTTVGDLLKQCGGSRSSMAKLVMGGPMMGVALQSLAAPVVKGTSGLLVLEKQETTDNPEGPCIRCAKCVNVCPMSLMPNEMAWLAKNDQFDALADHDLFDCIECGTCSYVCPSSIPLVHYFRYGKFAIQGKKRAKHRSDVIKVRTEMKERRVAAEKAAREAKKAALKANRGAAKEPAAAVAATDEGAEAGEEKAAKIAKAKAAVAAAKAAKAESGGAEPVVAAGMDEKAAKIAKAKAAAAAAKAAREAGRAGEVAAEPVVSAEVDEKAAKIAKAKAAAAAAKAAKAAREAAGE